MQGTLLQLLPAAGRAVARTGRFRGTGVPVLVVAAMVVNAGFALPCTGHRGWRGWPPSTR